LILGSISTGAENDLREATDIASRMVAQYGMSSELGPAFYEHHPEHPFLGQKIATDSSASEATTHAIEAEARALLRRALEQAGELLESHRAALDDLIDDLLHRETLEKRDLDELLGNKPGLGRAAMSVALR